MRRLGILVVTGLLLASGQPVAAQASGTIEGRVVDADSGAPIAGASVSGFGPR